MKEKIITISFLSILFGFFIYSIVDKDIVLSFSERRKLSQFPVWENKIDKDYLDKMETYLMDQFPLRDTFRQLKATTEFHFLQKLDHNGTFYQKNKIFKLESTIDWNSIDFFLKKIENVTKTYAVSNPRIYYSIIPDKNYYLEDARYPKLDYDALVNKVKHELSSQMTYIDLFQTLDLDSYYDTDIHWRQEKLQAVVKKIERAMQLSNIPCNYKKVDKYPFYGALYGQLALSKRPDTITYLTNEHLENVRVSTLDKTNLSVYNEARLDSVDAYDVFLHGAQPLVTIENDAAPTERELILFRDSFGSSLAPLLISSYRKITLVDLRYLSSTLLSQYIDFEQSDLLFLYSVPVINQSYTLK